MSERPSLKSLIRPRFRGALIGGAVGDALGFPHEGSSRSYMVALGDRLVEGYERHRSGYYPLGQFSDDTQMTLATAEAIAGAGEIDGGAVAAALIPLWRENRVVGRNATCTEALQRLMDEEADWTTSGVDGRTDTGAAMRAVPIGLWSYDAQEEIPDHAARLTAITHRATSAQAAAAAVAAAVAYNVTHGEIILGDFVDAVGGAAAALDPAFGAAIARLPLLLSTAEVRALEDIAVVGLEVVTPEAREAIVDEVGPTVLMALYSFLRSPTDYLAVVHRCLLAGGNVDTSAAIAGAVAGAMNGIAAVPRALIDDLPVSDTILEIADALHARKEAERSRAGA